MRTWGAVEEDKDSISIHRKKRVESAVRADRLLTLVSSLIGLPYMSSEYRLGTPSTGGCGRDDELQSYYHAIT